MTRSIEKSLDLHRQAQELIPGGVSSPVRAFRAVGGQPLFLSRARGAHVFDVDGNAYIDYVLSWGPLILGHAHPAVLKALETTASRGTSFGAPSPLEIELARAIQHFMPQLEMLRFVNSGTEATMSALRLARAFTGREKIIKFEGCYHGHADMLLVQAGSGVATLGLPDSPGVPAAVAADTLVARFNDLENVQALFQSFPGEIAAVIVEPVAGNMGVVLPGNGFLSGLRQVCDAHGSLLIFDEVMTGFRVHPGGAQTLYDIQPDLTTLGKVIGGGLPVGAYGGRRDIMALIAPSGPVYQAGTLSGNPLAMAAGLATLGELRKEGAWQSMEAAAARLESGVAETAAEVGVALAQARCGTMFSAFFNDSAVTDWPSAKTSDTQLFGRFFNALLDHGVYIAPSQFEAGFISTAHDQAIIDQTLDGVRAAMKIAVQG